VFTLDAVSVSFGGFLTTRFLSRVLSVSEKTVSE
jgi:hypothetical protein